MKFETKLSIVLCLIVLIITFGVVDGGLMKGAFNPFAPQKKIKVVSPIPAVPKNIQVLNVGKPNCAALDAAAAAGHLSGDSFFGQYWYNWGICHNGDGQSYQGFPTICESIDLSLANNPNGPDRNMLLSGQDTCRNGGIAQHANRWMQEDGGQLINKNCAALFNDDRNGVWIPKERDNYAMCIVGNQIDFYSRAKVCDIARWALAANPAQYFALTDDVDTCANGGVNP